MSERREGLCEKCGAEYPVWYAPNPLWNEVMRGGVRANADEFAFICPTCFANVADERREPAIWTLMEDGMGDAYLRAELDTARADSHAQWQRSVALREQVDAAGAVIEVSREVNELFREERSSLTGERMRVALRLRGAINAFDGSQGLP